MIFNVVLSYCDDYMLILHAIMTLTGVSTVKWMVVRGRAGLTCWSLVFCLAASL